MYAYPAKLTVDGNAIVVTFPDVPEAATSGSNRKEALTEAVEALTAALSFYVDNNERLPTASDPKRGQVLVQLPTGIIAKLALYSAMREQGITQSELARRLGVHRQHVARIIDPAHNTKFEVLEAALAAIGLQVQVSITKVAA